MPETGAMQKDLGSAIAQLEVVRKTLLDVFEWCSQVGMFTDQERSEALMKVQIARVSFPVIDIALREFLAQWNVNTHQRITLVTDSPEDEE